MNVDLKYKVYGKSEIGLVRERNEDAFLVDEECELYAVADGLGGLPGGDVASLQSIETLREKVLEISEGEAIPFDEIFELISEEVNEIGRTIDPELGIASTLTAVKREGSKLLIGHVGDSGVIVFKRSGEWHQITKSHTMAEEMKDNAEPGDDLYIPVFYRHTLTQCIGKVKDIKVQTLEYEIEAGDRILLYTDGVTKVMGEDELSQLAAESVSARAFAEGIMEKGIAFGAPDNITAVVLFF